MDIDRVAPEARIAGLPCWRGRVAVEPLAGGLTNRNFLVREGRERYVVRLGEDMPVHNIVRAHEVAASRAAAALGIAPEVVHAEPGVLVLRHIDGRTLTGEDVRRPEMLERLVPVLKRCHAEMPRRIAGPVATFQVFRILDSYAAILRRDAFPHTPGLPRLRECAATLEREVGLAAPVFCHNDLLAANFIDDGARVWLIDWEYAGWNDPLFDLANLASNNELAPAQARALIGAYFGLRDGGLERRFAAMACASLLREAMWGMVARIHSTLEHDFSGYTATQLERFERAYGAFAAGRDA